MLHVIMNLNYGGMERLLADIVRRADPARFESQVLALQYVGRFGEGLEDAAPVHLARPMTRASMLYPRRLAGDLARIAPDVVHSHGGVWFKTALAARLAGVPRMIHTEHGRRRPDPWLYRTLDGLAARQTDVVVAVSDVLARHLAEHVVHDRARIRVVTNGVDTELYRPRPDTGAVRAQLALSPDVPIVGSIGRLEQIKGYDVMVEAFALLRRDWDAARDGPSPALVVGGDGAERARVDALVAGHGLGGAAHFLGWRDDVHDLQSCFALFTMSSRSEGTSVSLLEAMSSGLCPVVTNVGGNAAVLGDALRHRLVPAEDPAALAAAWRAVLTDRAARERDARAARERVRERFALETMVRAYEALYAGAEPRAPDR